MMTKFTLRKVMWSMVSLCSVLARTTRMLEVTMGNKLHLPISLAPFTLIIMVIMVIMAIMVITVIMVNMIIMVNMVTMVDMVITVDMVIMVNIMHLPIFVYLGKEGGEGDHLQGEERDVLNTSVFS